MKKSLSVFVSVIFAVMCMMVSVNAFAQGENVIDTSNTTIAVNSQDLIYNSKPIKPTVIVTYNGTVLKNGVDYTVAYTENVIEAGTKFPITVTGIGNFSGTVTKEFTVRAASLSASGKSSVTFTAQSYVYNNAPVTPVVNVAYDKGDGAGMQYLIQNIDYTVTYSNNNAPGKGQVKITGIGNFKDSITKSFTILPAKVTNVSINKLSNTSLSINWSGVNGASGYEVLVYDASKNSYVHLDYVGSNTTSYTVSKLSSGNTYYYQVRAYKNISDKMNFGESSDAVGATLNPAKIKLKSVTKNKSTLNIEWTKTNCSGYIISYTTDKKFKKGIKTININNANTVSKKVKKINKKKTYYVKIKAYVVNGGQTYYSANSTMLSTYYSNVYATYSSYYVNNKDRTTNLKIASKKINGTIIQPGETFDFNKVVGPRTASKGYKKAHVFSGGDVTMGLAGGICQVASTCFNTALIGNVQIVERHQHSQRVSYVPLGRDAAIYGNVQNFRWKNNTKYAIRVGMKVENGVISCTFYTCQKAKPKKVSLKVTQKGKNFTLKRTVGKKVNYSCRSNY